jgi:hypothetical protein
MPPRANVPEQAANGAAAISIAMPNRIAWARFRRLADFLPMLKSVKSDPHPLVIAGHPCRVLAISASSDNAAAGLARFYTCRSWPAAKHEMSGNSDTAGRRRS